MDSNDGSVPDKIIPTPHPAETDLALELLNAGKPVKMSAAEGIASMQRRIALLETELANFQRLKEKEEVKRCKEAIAECQLRIKEYELQSGGLN